MSLPRYAAKRDTSEPGIVEALKRAGFTVERLAKPVDLAVRRHWYPRGANVLLECKTPKPNGTLPERKDRAVQTAFCDAGGALKVGTPEDALTAMAVFELSITP